MQSNNYLIIMAGGVGTRFWPLSRMKKPKQFLDILGSGKTLLQMTVSRFEGIIPLQNIIVVTGKDYVNLVQEQLPDLPAANILSEPMPKNTAPCVALACYKILTLNPEANIVVSPSDHLILDNRLFQENVSHALSITANNPVLATLGLVPTYPSTGYGYIQPDSDTRLGKLNKVKTFAEKPNIEVAEYFFKSGEFLWNSGIFIGNVETFISAFRLHLEDIAEIFSGLTAFFGTANEEKAITEAYFRCRSISMDYGVMEVAQNVFVLPCQFGWSDLGSWKSVYDTKPHDHAQNVVIGEALLYDTQDCIIRADEGCIVVAKGLKDFIIAQHDGAVLVCPMSSEQEIRQFLYDIKEKTGHKFS